MRFRGRVSAGDVTVIGMERCDVLIVGGGPAGSACARRLHDAGLDVVVLDKATFPRDKVCAGWITPQVVDDLDLDTTEYRKGRTFQPITSFIVGVIGRDRRVQVEYGRAVSFGIRRCEFDDYLLKRSGARIMEGAGATQIRREHGGWIVGERLAAPMLVGAGGHFCPVPRVVNRTRAESGGDGTPPAGEELVAAREAEFMIEPGATEVAAERPEMYFCEDLTGYGWCFRKQEHLNVGLGQLNARALPAATNAFVSFLEETQRLQPRTSWPWRGHAYLLAGPARPAVGDGVVLVGDAAGLAYPESGEGIRPAIESGLMAASAIVGACGRYSADRLACYERNLRTRFAPASAHRLFSGIAPPQTIAALGHLALRSRLFVRRYVLDRWFLHADRPALART